MTIKEGKEIFGYTMMKEMCEGKIKEIMNERALCKAELERFIGLSAENMVDGFVYDVSINALKARINEYDKQISVWEYNLSLINGRKKKNNSVDISLIKRIPIRNLLGKPTMSSGKIDYYKCVKHAEKTASMAVYRENNRAHCFGCGESFDVIDVVIHRDKVDFKEAVKLLSNISA